MLNYKTLHTLILNISNYSLAFMGVIGFASPTKRGGAAGNSSRLKPMHKSDIGDTGDKLFIGK
jgi:hypothetical protein